MKYICNTTCWVAGKKKAMFVVGDIVDFAEDEVVPGHFTCIEKKEETPKILEVMVEETKVESPKIEETKNEPLILQQENEFQPKRKPKRSGD